MTHCLYSGLGLVVLLINKPFHVTSTLDIALLKRMHKATNLMGYYK